VTGASMSDKARTTALGPPAGVDLLRLVFDRLEEPMVLIDPTFRIALSNRAARRIDPRLAEGGKGLLCCQVVHGRPTPCGDAQPACPLRQAFERGQAATLKHEQPAAGGEKRVLEVTASPIRDDDGRFWGVLQTVRDVTEPARTEYILSRARNEWLTTADSVPDLIFLTDLEGRIIRCNRSAKVFLDRDYSELLGSTLREAFRRTGGEASVLDLDRGEMHCERPRATLAAASYPANLGDRPYGTVWVMRDVTAIRRLESIASSVDMMNNFGHVLATVRHELGNPINAIKTALSVLVDNFESFSEEKKRVYLDRCLEDVGRVQALLENLRTFNMFESVRCEQVDVFNFLRHVAELVGEQLRSQRIAFALRLPSGEGPQVSADKRALQQVILGLVSNAADAVAGRRRPRITLEADLEQAEVRLAVADNGVGISPADLPMVFLPLFTTKANGTGLGLAIARSLVARMNGTVELESRLWHGTRVEVTLPRLEPQQALVADHGSG